METLSFILTNQVLFLPQKDKSKCLILVYTSSVSVQITYGEKYGLFNENT